MYQALHIQGVVTVGFVISHRITKNITPFSDEEFIKECLVESVRLKCPENTKNENVALTRRTLTKHTEDTAGHLELQMKNKCDHFGSGQDL